MSGSTTHRDPIRVYDARWEADEFNRAEIRRLVEATLLYGRLLGVDTVTLCRDARGGCAPLVELAMEMALAAGFDVFLCPDPVSTPLSYFMSFSVSERRPGTMGLMFTASHNPATYVGLKVVVPPVQAIGLNCGPLGGFARIREIYHGQETLGRPARGRLQVWNPAQDYVEFSLRTVGVGEGTLAGVSVVFDFFNGSAGGEMLVALQRAGAAFTPLRLVADGTFPTGSPNPTSAGKMTVAVDLAREKSGSVVIGTDGDGDRLVFGDARGLLSAGIAAVPVLARLTAPGETRRPRVLYDPKVDPLARAEWSRIGMEPSLFRNGHSQIKERMRAMDAAAAVEESGHYYHRLLGTAGPVYLESSLVTVLSFLRSIRERPSLMDELWALQDRAHSTGEFNYQLGDDHARDEALEEALRLFRADGAEVTSRTADGADLMGFLVSKGIDARSSSLAPEWYQAYLRIATNEKSVLRCYVSAGDPSGAREWERRIRQRLSALGGTPVE